MTGRSRHRARNTSTLQAAADAFPACARYANPNTRRGYTNVLDRLLAQLGADARRPRLPASGRQAWWSSYGGGAPTTWNRHRGQWPPGCPSALSTGCLPRSVGARE